MVRSASCREYSFSIKVKDPYELHLFVRIFDLRTERFSLLDVSSAVSLSLHQLTYVERVGGSRPDH